MMSEALVTTRDGIVGYWPATGKMPARAPQTRPDSDLMYMTATYRGFVLDHILSRAFAVTTSGAKSGDATVMLGKTALLKVVRPADAVFLTQLQHLKTYADLRAERIAEITVQITDLISFFGALCQLDSGRRRYTVEALNTVQRLCYHVEFMAKHFCRAARPVDLSPQVQPMIQTPSHSSYPNGHATEAFAIATVVNALMGGTDPAKDMIAGAPEFRLAERIAANRIVAGVHFPIDTLAGAALGVTIGRAFLALATGGKVLAKGKAGGFKGPEDFSLTEAAALLGKPVAGPGKDDACADFWAHVAHEW